MPKVPTAPETPANSVVVTKNTEPVPAQVVAPAKPAPTTVPVSETFVSTDVVITDPSHPLAVQPVEAGKGSTALPIHQLENPRPEDVFAADAAKS